MLLSIIIEPLVYDRLNKEEKKSELPTEISSTHRNGTMKSQCSDTIFIYLFYHIAEKQKSMNEEILREEE